MMDFSKMPASWALTSLGTVCKLRNGYAFKSDQYTTEGVPVIRISDIGEGKVVIDSCVKVLQETTYIDYAVKFGDILVAMSGATTGKFGIYRSNELAFQNQRVGRFEILHASAFKNDYLLFLLFALKRKILEDAYGGAQPNISSGKIEEMEIPLPPIAEQQRIVAKIEELFSELDKGVETLKTAKQQLKVYRQAVLKSAFEGRLTKVNRERGDYPDTNNLIKNIKLLGAENNIKLKYKSVEYDVELPQIPSSWTWLRNEELLKYVTSGSRDWKKYYNNTGSIFIRTQDIKTNLLDLSNSAFVKLPDKVEGKRSLVESGDILMTITGANVGKVAVIPENIPEAYVSQSVALMKLLDNKMSKYLWYYFQSRNYGEGLIGGLVYGVGRPVLSLENMKEVPVAVCSIEEQYDIVQEIESRLSVCDKIEESIEQGLQQAEALRQSILKKAFEGKLVPQDPNDEPASVLLERIKAERAAAQPEKKTKTKKVKA